MKPVMYIFANRGLGMSAPKLAGMVLQAGILSYEAQCYKSDALQGQWMSSGMMKVVLEAEDEEQLRNIERYVNERGFKTFAVIDEGRTEVRPFSFTTLAVELVDKDEPKVAETFGQFKTYREPKPEPVREPFKPWYRRWYESLGT